MTDNKKAEVISVICYNYRNQRARAEQTMIQLKRERNKVKRTFKKDSTDFLNKECKKHGLNINGILRILDLDNDETK